MNPPSDGIVELPSYFTREVSRYEKLDRIGEGTYGTVYRAREKDTGRIVALKKIRHSATHNKSGVTSLREINILRSIAPHKNIVYLYDVVVGKRSDTIFLVFEYCSHDICSLAYKYQFTEGQTKQIILQILSATDHLHKNFIMHRDLKLSNLLITRDGVVKLADFGLSRSFGIPLKDYTPDVVTLWYRAPELLLGSTKYHTAQDMWALGCVFAELLQNKPLLPGNTVLDQISEVYQLLGSPNEKIWPGYSQLPLLSKAEVKLPEYPYSNLAATFPDLSDNGLDLMSRLLTYDPSKRITAAKAMEHPYFVEKPFPTPISDFPKFPSKSEQKKSSMNMNVVSEAPAMPPSSSSSSSASAFGLSLRASLNANKRTSSQKEQMPNLEAIPKRVTRGRRV
jgi:serine/threonine protein kinase